MLACRPPDWRGVGRPRECGSVARRICLRQTALVPLGESSQTHAREPRHEQAAGSLRNESRAWIEVPADDNGDAMVAAMAEAGVDYLFFTSGSEIGFYQEAIAKAHAQGRKAPKLITVTHEHACLNAALGYAAVSGKPAVPRRMSIAARSTTAARCTPRATAACRWSSPAAARRPAIPAACAARATAAATSGCSRASTRTASCGSTPSGTTAWRLQDNPGLMVTRALQVARTEPCGPVYLSLPREVSLPDQGREVSDRWSSSAWRARRARSRRHPRDRAAAGQGGESVRRGGALGPQSGDRAGAGATVRADGAPVAQSGLRAYQCFPMNHPLYMSGAACKDADVVLALEVDVPWHAGPNPPPTAPRWR